MRPAAERPARRAPIFPEAAAKSLARPPARRDFAKLPREGLGEVHERLDKLSQQLERLARAEIARRPLATRQGPSPQASSEPSDERNPRLTGAPPQRRRPMPEPQGDRPASTERPPDRRSSLGGSRELSIEDAVAEITARQRVLDGEAAAQPPVDTPQTAAAPIAAPVAAPIPAPVAALDLSGLEKQLRQITTRIEALRPPSDIEKAIAAVRTDLTEISRQLTEALPRRAVESLEIEVKALAERIDHSRQSGVDFDRAGRA